MNFSEDERKHIDLLQAVISRMATNSFLLRGWTVTLLAALFALAAKDANRTFVAIAYFPAITFWILDAYYVSLERRFRRLYERVVSRDGIKPYFMTPGKEEADNWIRAFFSTTMLLFHFLLILVISLVIVFIPAN